MNKGQICLPMQRLNVIHLHSHHQPDQSMGIATERLNDATACYKKGALSVILSLAPVVNPNLA